MTLTEALYALNAAGRLKRSWLSGMLIRLDWQPEDGHGPIQMRLCADGEHVIAFTPPTLPGGPAGHRYEPVLDDPATVGCLHALAEEAVGRRLEIHWCGGPSGCDCWFVWDPSDEAGDNNEMATGATRGEALAAALVALAEQGERRE